MNEVIQTQFLGITECIFTLLTKLKVTIVILLVAHPEGVGMQHETPF